MRASDIVLDSNISMLMKGPWGYGKTIAAASFALDGPIYIAYWDKKKPIELITFFSKFPNGKEILSRIEYDVYGSHNANEFLNKLISLSKDNRYFAFINDSVTNMTSGAVNWSLGFSNNKKKNKTDADGLTPGFDEYKVETSLVTQSLDICRTLSCHIIWTCHPVPGIKIEGAGSSIKVTKVNPIVTYGSKVAGIVPGNFSEIYHFSKLSNWDSNTGESKTKFIVNVDAVGDDFAKSNLGLKEDFDITDKLFYSVWKEEVAKLKEELENNVKKLKEENNVNPFDKPQTAWKT